MPPHGTLRPMILGRDLTTLATLAVLMVVCGGGIARLLWLIEGRPHLDRPALVA